MRKMLAKNNLNYKIRQANKKDIEQMALVDKMCFSVPWTKEDFIKELTENSIALYMVAEADGELLGYAGVWTVVDEGHIMNIAVHPEHRENGIGKRLVDAMLREARARAGTKKFTLEVRVSNEPAIKLYESFGFKELGRRKGYYSDNKEDAAIMWLVDSDS